MGHPAPGRRRPARRAPGTRPDRPPARFPLRRSIAAACIVATLGAAAALTVGLLGGSVLLPAASASPADRSIEAVVVTDADPAAAASIVCPDVAGLLTAVPAAAQLRVNHELAALEHQVAAATDRLSSAQGRGGPDFAQNAVLRPLAGKRAVALHHIRTAVERAGGTTPAGLDDLAACSLAQ